MIQDRAIVTMEPQGTLCDLSNGAISNDLEQHLTQISKSHSYNGILIGSRLTHAIRKSVVSNDL